MKTLIEFVVVFLIMTISYFTSLQQLISLTGKLIPVFVFEKGRRVVKLNNEFNTNYVSTACNF